MKFSWLALSLLAGGGAAIGTVSDKVLNSEGRILVKGVPDQRRERDLESAALQSPSANTVTINLDAVEIALPTKSQHTAQAGDASNPPGQPPDEEEEELSSVTPRSDKGALPDGESDSAARPPSSSPGSDREAEFDETAGGAPNGAGKAGNPASANRAIAGMSVGLVSVMLIFTIFL
ncbi:hypothetical protein VTH82DRAFT_8107 [Thermothelomyces myriococcoides]